MTFDMKKWPTAEDVADYRADVHDEEIANAADWAVEKRDRISELCAFWEEVASALRARHDTDCDARAEAILSCVRDLLRVLSEPSTYQITEE